MQSRENSRHMRGVLAIIAATGVLMLAAGALAQHAGRAPVQAQGAQASLAVGTYNLQDVFEKHPASQKLSEAANATQAQMQKAQKDGNQQQIEQARQQYEQQRAQIVQSFHSELKSVIPTAAKAAGVKIVATEIAYLADDVETKDITPQLAAALSKRGGSEDAKQPARMPAMPGRQ